MRQRIDFKNKSLNFDVDLVYTWVDGSDELWQQQKQQFLCTDKSDCSLKRYNTIQPNKMICESLKLALKNLIGIRKIFVVTMRPQIPNCLKKDGCLHQYIRSKKIIIIYHDQIYPDISHLPTFNSLSIECWLHRIPGLAENFIYSNDDVFVTRKTNVNQFFDPETRKPYIRASIFFPFKFTSFLKNQDDIVFNESWLKLFEFFGIVSQPNHFLHPMTITIMNKIYFKYKDIIDLNSKTKIRSKDDIPIFGLATNYALQYNLGNLITNDQLICKYVKNYDNFTLSYLRNIKPNVICIESETIETSNIESYI